MSHIVGISEIVLWTDDIEASLAFYRDLLGLEVISPPDLRNAFLKAGDGNAGVPQMIVLVPKPDEITSRPARGEAKPEGFQLNHLALEVSDDEFDALHADLVDAGYEPRGGVHPVIASRTMYVDDPDGNEVELICRAPANK